MTRYRFNAINGNTLRAVDGEIGSVWDLFFEDAAWEIKYLVADTGNWLPGRKVLLSPSVLKKTDWKTGDLPVDLTREQIKNSPDIDTNKPVSLQMQEKLVAYYGWSSLQFYPYWPATGAYVPPPTLNPAIPLSTEPPSGEPLLRSCLEILQYSIEGRDGEIGSVDDIIINTVDWKISLIVVETGGWLTGRKILFSPSEIRKISWSDKSLLVHLFREQVQGSPEYVTDNPIDEEFEKRLQEHHGIPPRGP